MQLKNRQLLNFKFRRQFPIEPYIVDFVCLELNLIIELDGSQHNEQNDSERTLFLIKRGFKLICFWNNDMFNNKDGVMEKIRLTSEEQKKQL